MQFNCDYGATKIMSYLYYKGNYNDNFSCSSKTYSKIMFMIGDKSDLIDVHKSVE